MTRNIEAQREAENLKRDEVEARRGWSDKDIGDGRHKVELDLLRINKMGESFSKEVLSDLTKIDAADGYLPVIGLTQHQLALKGELDVMNDSINANERREHKLPPDAPEYKLNAAIDKSIGAFWRNDVHLKPDASELDLFKASHPQDWYTLLGLHSKDAKADDVDKAFEKYTVQKYENRMNVSDDMSKQKLAFTLLEKSDPALSKALGLSSPPTLPQVTALLHQRIKLRAVIGLEQNASDADVIERLHAISSYPILEAQREKEADKARRFGDGP